MFFFIWIYVERRVSAFQLSLLLRRDAVEYVITLSGLVQYVITLSGLVQYVITLSGLVQYVITLSGLVTYYKPMGFYVTEEPN